MTAALMVVSKGAKSLLLLAPFHCYKLSVSRLRLNTISNRQLRRKLWQTPAALGEAGCIPLCYSVQIDVAEE
jgi:hypothetical protein